MTEAGGLNVNGLRVRYVGRREPALEDVSLAVEPGSVVGVTGRTGAGKSTLALASSGFVPRVVRAEVGGTVEVSGVDALKATLAELAGKVGVVFSAPALQLSASKPTVREELAFGLENLAVPRDEMDERIDRVLDQLGIASLAEREPLALSGGEQQRVAIASILVMGTRLIVLDEPAAQLDPGGTVALATLLQELAVDGRAILVTEHAPELLAVAGELLVLDAGRVTARGLPGEALASDPQAPTIVRLAAAADVPAEDAFDELAVAKALSKRRGKLTPTTASAAGRTMPSVFHRDPPLITVRGLVHRFRNNVTALRGVNLTIAPGEIVAIVGQNGSGKTTLVKHFNGLLQPSEGEVIVGGHNLRGKRVSDSARQVGFVFQNPDDQLFNGRVDREVAFGPRNLRLPPVHAAHFVERALALVGLSEERATNPYDLGFSLRKLVALASVIAMDPPALVLDEPTTGQDGPGVERVGAIVDAWADAGRTVVAVTHDMEFAARHFWRVVVMRQGEVVLDGPPEVVFSGDHAELLSSTGLRPPPATRVAALMGLSSVYADASALLRALAAPGHHGVDLRPSRLGRLIDGPPTRAMRTHAELRHEIERLLRSSDAGKAELQSFLRAATPSQWMALDTSMRQDHRTTWRQADAPASHGPARSDVIEIGLASMDRDGRVREAAVRELDLQTDPMAGPFLALRTADWVDEVAALANRILAARLEQDSAARVSSVPILFAMSGRRRRSELIQLVLARASTDAPMRWSLLTSRDARTRRLVVRESAIRGALTFEELLTLAFTDPDANVSSAAGVEAVSRIGAANLTSDLSRLLRGPALVRQAVIDALATKREGRDIAERHLFDRSRAVRQAAQRTYVRQGGDPVGLYRAALLRSEHVPIAITELAAIGSSSDRPAVVSALRSTDAAVRKAAVTASRWVGVNQLDAMIGPLLWDPAPSVTKAAGRRLRAFAHELNRAALFRLAGDSVPHHRSAAFRLLRRRGSLDRLEADLVALADASELIREVAGRDIQSWLARAASTSPRGDLRLRRHLHELLLTVEGQLPKNTVEPIRFHAGLRPENLANDQR